MPYGYYDGLVGMNMILPWENLILRLLLEILPGWALHYYFGHGMIGPKTWPYSHLVRYLSSHITCPAPDVRRHGRKVIRVQTPDEYLARYMQARVRCNIFSHRKVPRTSEHHRQNESSARADIVSSARHDRKERTTEWLFISQLWGKRYRTFHECVLVER